jgi:hypothetical protein
MWVTVASPSPLSSSLAWASVDYPVKSPSSQKEGDQGKCELNISLDLTRKTENGSMAFRGRSSGLK